MTLSANSSLILWENKAVFFFSREGHKYQKTKVLPKLTLVGAGVVKVVQDGHEYVEHVATLENVEHELLVDVTHAPEED